MAPNCVQLAPAAVALLCLVFWPGTVTAQDDQVGAYRIRTDMGESIRLDGLLTEDVWSSAAALSGFTQREPDEGVAATEETVVRIAYDEHMLYIGVAAHDSEPDEIVARILQRDKLIAPIFFGAGIQFAGDDAIAILLDPFHDHRNAMVFATNPNGAEFEALVTDEGSLNIDWRGVWEVKGARTPTGWSAEFAIPWQTLRYPEASGDEPWGINVFRVIRRKNEDVLWQSWQREGGGFLRVSRAGHLTGLADLPQQGLSLETKTFLLAGRRQEANELGAITSSYQREVGIDIKTEVRPGLVLDLTVNTDFAQVEVDDAQVNLTRFSLFFPEKRDFFLENSGIFDFGLAGEGGMRTPAYQMLFSRNIGISRDGAVPILAGARLTGRVGGQTVGLLNVVTDEAYGAPRENFAVARIKRDVGQSAYIGAMMVDRRSSDGWNTTAGIDGQFVIGSAWIWDWYAAQSFTEGQGRDGYSYSLKHSYDGPDWRASFTHYAVSPNADAAGGFITRTDIRQTDAYAGPKFRPSALGLRDVGMFFMGGYGTTVSDGRMQDWRAGIGMNPTWKSGEQFTAILNTSETVVDEGFRLSESVEVPAGRYRADRLNWFAFSSPRRAAVLGSSVTISNFYGGTLMSLGGTLSVAPSPQISFTGGYTRNQVDVPDGGFNADISSLRASYSYSTKLSTNVLVQYNSLQKAFSTNVRFNFIHRPGSDFFIVFTENHGWDGQGWELSDRGTVMKLTYLARM